jgi:type II secretory pathway component PulF
MKLAYVAFDKAGQQVTDVIEAPGAPAAADMLRRQGLFVTKVEAGEARGASAPARAPRARGSKVRRLKDLAILLRQLHALVSCGTPVVPALEALERQTRRGAWRNALADVRAKVEEGTPLSVAVESHPEYFDTICRSLMAAGESSGTLPAMLDRIATMARKEVHVRTVVMGAMVYPALLLTVATGVMATMLTVVIPKFSDLFKNLDVPLPPTTAALVAVSAWLHVWWWAALAGVVAAAVGAKILWGRPATHRAIDTLLLALPQVGKIVRGFATARITRILGVLVESHVNILDALSLTRQSMSNHHYIALVARAEEAVTRGKPISTAFTETDLVLPSVGEAVRSGEQSGQVGRLLLNVADFLDEENEVVVRSLTSIIEPVILVIMGLVVGLVSVSMFLPLFDLTAMTQGGGGR